MSVVIENMEMPKDCVHCRFNNASGQITTLCDLVGGGWIKIKENHRADECPLAETQPEIVRCKDCIHADYARKDVLGRIYCLNHGFYWDALAYCSYAERRTNETN